jgi:ribosomal protein S18 acetylase RimI-like enzyme
MQMEDAVPDGNVEFEVRLGEFAVAAGIMTEAAKWLIGRGQRLWPLDEVTEEALRSRDPRGHVLVGYVGGEPAVAALLEWQDPWCWPGKTDSGFIHRLAVRRQYAGQGHAEALLQWAAAACRTSGKAYLRLDCVANRDRLCAFYERCGFRRVGRAVREPHYDQALYELATG